jgi:hypothetical protein
MGLHIAVCSESDSSGRNDGCGGDSDRLAMAMGPRQNGKVRRKFALMLAVNNGYSFQAPGSNKPEALPHRGCDSPDSIRSPEIGHDLLLLREFQSFFPINPPDYLTLA